MQKHVHTCYFCERHEEVEAVSSPQTKLPEKWKWMTRRKEGENAVAVCPGCWLGHLTEVVMGRNSNARQSTDGKGRKGCCG